MAATDVTTDDLDWLVDVLRGRREALVPHAPVFWRPAPDADARHRAYLHHLLTDGGARAWRTPTSVVVAARRGAGWLVDDLHVEDWSSDAPALWDAFAAHCSGDEVRLVAPTYEAERGSFAASVGLAVAESWWLLELSSSGGEPGDTVELPGAEALTVTAPPVYAPPGPMMFLATVTDASALPAAVDRAPALGCAGLVVSQRPDGRLGPALEGLGLRRHCDFHEGVVRPVDSGSGGR